MLFVSRKAQLTHLTESYHLRIPEDLDLFLEVMDDDIEFGEINDAAEALLDMMRSLEYD